MGVLIDFNHKYNTPQKVILMMASWDLDYCMQEA